MSSSNLYLYSRYGKGQKTVNLLPVGRQAARVSNYKRANNIYEFPIINNIEEIKQILIHNKALLLVDSSFELRYIPLLKHLIDIGYIPNSINIKVVDDNINSIETEINNYYNNGGRLFFGTQKSSVFLKLTKWFKEHNDALYFNSGFKIWIPNIDNEIPDNMIITSCNNLNIIKFIFNNIICNIHKHMDFLLGSSFDNIFDFVDDSLHNGQVFNQIVYVSDNSDLRLKNNFITCLQDYIQTNFSKDTLFNDSITLKSFILNLTNNKYIFPNELEQLLTENPINSNKFASSTTKSIFIFDCFDSANCQNMLNYFSKKEYSNNFIIFTEKFLNVSINDTNQFNTKFNLRYSFILSVNYSELAYKVSRQLFGDYNTPLPFIDIFSHLLDIFDRIISSNNKTPINRLIEYLTNSFSIDRNEWHVKPIYLYGLKQKYNEDTNSWNFFSSSTIFKKSFNDTNTGTSTLDESWIDTAISGYPSMTGNVTYSTNNTNYGTKNATYSSFFTKNLNDISMLFSSLQEITDYTNKLDTFFKATPYPNSTPTIFGIWKMLINTKWPLATNLINPITINVTLPSQALINGSSTNKNHWLYIYKNTINYTYNSYNSSGLIITSNITDTVTIDLDMTYSADNYLVIFNKGNTYYLDNTNTIRSPLVINFTLLANQVNNKQYRIGDVINISYDSDLGTNVNASIDSISSDGFTFGVTRFENENSNSITSSILKQNTGVNMSLTNLNSISFMYVNPDITSTDNNSLNLWSSNGCYYLSLLPSGVLAANDFRTGLSFWSSGSGFSNAYSLQFRVINTNNIKLELLDSYGNINNTVANILVSTNSLQFPLQLIVRDDRNICIIDNNNNVLWSENTNIYLNLTNGNTISNSNNYKSLYSLNGIYNLALNSNGVLNFTNVTNNKSPLYSITHSSTATYLNFSYIINSLTNAATFTLGLYNSSNTLVYNILQDGKYQTSTIFDIESNNLVTKPFVEPYIFKVSNNGDLIIVDKNNNIYWSLGKADTATVTQDSYTLSNGSPTLISSNINGISAVQPRQGDYVTVHESINPQYSGVTATISMINSDKSVTAIFYDENDANIRSNIKHEKPELRSFIITESGDTSGQNFMPVSNTELFNLTSDNGYYTASIGDDCFIRVRDNRNSKEIWQSNSLEVPAGQTIKKCNGLILDNDTESLYIDTISENIQNLNSYSQNVILNSRYKYTLQFYAYGNNPITVDIRALNSPLEPVQTYTFTPTNSGLQLVTQQFLVNSNDTFNITFYPNLSNFLLKNGAIINTDQIDSTKSLVLSSLNSQYLQITDSFTTESTGMSFSFWFKSNNNLTWSRIFDFGNGSANDNIIVFINNSNLGFSVYKGNLSTQYNSVIPGLNNNTWNHITWTLDTINGWKIYLNGILYISLSNVYYPNAIQRTFNYIGKSNWSADPYFNGSIKDFRYYNGVLISSVVANIYANPLKNNIVSINLSSVKNISITNEEQYYIFDTTNKIVNYNSLIMQDDGNLCLYRLDENKNPIKELWCSMVWQTESWNSIQYYINIDQNYIQAFQTGIPNIAPQLISTNGYFYLGMDQGTLGVRSYLNNTDSWLDPCFKYIGKPFFYSGQLTDPTSKQLLDPNLIAKNKDDLTIRTVYNSGTLWQNYSNFNNTASTGNYWNDIYSAVLNQFSFSNSDIYNLVDNVSVIWVRKDATTNTNWSSSETNNYYYTYNNTTGKTIRSILWVSVLEQCDIYISSVNNGGKIATHGSTTTYGTKVWSYEFDLPPGNTTFEFKNTYNTSKRCGLAFICFPKYISSCNLYLDNTSGNFGSGNLLVDKVRILATDNTTVDVDGITNLQPYAITNFKTSGSPNPYTISFEDNGDGGSNGVLSIINNLKTTLFSSKASPEGIIDLSLFVPTDRNGILNAGVKLYAQQDENELESFLWSPSGYSYFGITVDTSSQTQSVCIFDARFTKPVYTFYTSKYTTLTSLDAISYLMLTNSGSIVAYNNTNQILYNITSPISGSNFSLKLDDSNVLYILSNNTVVASLPYNHTWGTFENYILSSETAKYYNGRILTSSNGNYTLTLDNGSLNINSVTDTSTSSSTTSVIKDIYTTTPYANLYTYNGSDSLNAYLTFNTNGVLNVHDSTGIKYSFGTSNIGIPGYKLILGNTGELAIYDCSIPKATAIDCCSVSKGWSAVINAYNNKLYIGNYGYNNYRWIWNAPNSIQGGPGVPAGTVNFYTTYTNTRTTNITATLYYSVDDTLNVYMNGNKLTSTTVPYNVVWAVTITLKPGISFFQFVATNGGGPAGLIFWCLENGNTNDATNTLFFSNPDTVYCSDGIVMSANDFGIQTWSSGTSYTEIIPYPKYTIDTSDIPENQLVSNEYNYKIVSSSDNSEEYTKLYCQNRLYYLRLEIDGSLSIYLSSSNKRIWSNRRPYSGPNNAARIGFVYNIDGSGTFGLWDSKNVSYGTTISVLKDVKYVFYLGNDCVLRLVGSNNTSVIFNP